MIKIIFNFLLIFLMQMSVNASYALTKEPLFSLNLHNKSIERSFFELGCLSGSRIRVTGQDPGYGFIETEIDNLSLLESIKYMLSDFNYVVSYGSVPSGELEFDIYILSKAPSAFSAIPITDTPGSHRSSVVQDIVSKPGSEHTTTSAYVSESMPPIAPFFSPLSSGFSGNDLEQIPVYSADLAIVPSDSTCEGLTVGDIESWCGLNEIPMQSIPEDFPITPSIDDTGLLIADTATYQDVMSLQIPDFPPQLALMPPDSENAGLTFEDLINEQDRNLSIPKPFVANKAIPITPPGRKLDQCDK